jgi:acyl-CoA synthetase (AMP-forming)/AMP-acid ligase II
MNKFDLKKGDCVAMYMENRPEYVCIFLGLSKLGVISALINTNLKHQQLNHCINVAKPKFLIYGSELEKSKHLFFCDTFKLKQIFHKNFIFI